MLSPLFPTSHSRWEFPPPGLASSKSPLSASCLHIASWQTKIRFSSKNQTDKTKNLRKTAKIIMQAKRNKIPQALAGEDLRNVLLIVFSTLFATA
jgi:hypothetical protein